MNTDRIIKVISEILSDRYDCLVTIKGLKGDKKNEEKDREVPYGSGIYGDCPDWCRAGRPAMDSGSGIGHGKPDYDDGRTEVAR